MLESTEPWLLSTIECKDPTSCCSWDSDCETIETSFSSTAWRASYCLDSIACNSLIMREYLLSSSLLNSDLTAALPFSSLDAKVARAASISARQALRKKFLAQN